MIRSFRDAKTEKLFNDLYVPGFALYNGLHGESYCTKGGRKGQYSIWYIQHGGVIGFIANGVIISGERWLIIHERPLRS